MTNVVDDSGSVEPSDPAQTAIEKSQVNIKQAIDGQSIDWFLQNLVSLVNTTPLEVGITLNVSGSLISGVLIGGKKYFELFAKEISDNFPIEDGPDGLKSRELLYDAYAQFGDIYNISSEDKINKNSPPQYIHLLNSRNYSADGAIPSNLGVLWRGKINAVSGFSLGQLSSDKHN